MDPKVLKLEKYKESNMTKLETIKKAITNNTDTPSDRAYLVAIAEQAEADAKMNLEVGWELPYLRLSDIVTRSARFLKMINEGEEK